MNNNLGKPLKLEISLDLIVKKYHEKERDYAKFLVKIRSKLWLGGSSSIILMKY
jgi:hypothetical protein